MKKMKELSLCVLSRNEGKNAENVIEELIRVFKKNKIDFEILPVSNGSTDNTEEVLEKLKRNHKEVRPVVTREKIGYGYAARIGLRKCTGRFIGFVDGDHQVSAEDVFKVYKKISKDSSISLCKGKRTFREDILTRVVISKIYNLLFRILFNIKLEDVNSCPKIIRIEDYKLIKLVQNDWFIDAEIIIKLNNLNKKIIEVPILYLRREEGSSNVRWTTILEFFKNIFKYRLNQSK